MIAYQQDVIGIMQQAPVVQSDVNIMDYNPNVIVCQIVHGTIQIYAAISLNVPHIQLTIQIYVFTKDQDIRVVNLQQ